MKPQRGVCLSAAQPHQLRVCSLGHLHRSKIAPKLQHKAVFSLASVLFGFSQDANNIHTREKQQLKVTVDDNRRRGAASFGHNVFSHAGVVCCVGEAGLLDDQVVIDGDVEVPVICRINDLFVLQPLHLRKRRSVNGRTALQTPFSCHHPIKWQKKKKITVKC